ncbi:hypothetical protein BST83_13175 [Polaribacter filamentus]|uniref:Peptidase S24 n=1 Tax=Polaribacter filamentus TaxID=53483 RepID=A0A2S7KZH5_9FLAO|nr:hypothetical protein [Polaribacter filamentus]PQB07996.1 hypothetical protein BST83_13175 [Polaribacter filamentus]
MNKVSNIKERIKEFAENTGENKDVFFQKIGVTSANFRGKKLLTGVNADLIEKIVSLYPDVDLNWLITGKEANKEEKEKTVMNEPPENYGNSYKDKYIEVLEENKELQKKVINLLEIKDNLKKYS